MNLEFDKNDSHQHQPNMLHQMKILLAVVFALSLTSCALDQCGPTKEAFLEKYENFVDDVESKDLEGSKKEWERVDKKFDKYLNECYTEYKDDLSQSEQSEFALNTMRYYYNKYGKDFYDKMDSNPEEFAKVVSENVEEFLHKYEDDIEDILEEITSSMDKKEMDELFEQGSDFLKTLDEDYNK